MPTPPFLLRHAPSTNFHNAYSRLCPRTVKLQLFEWLALLFHTTKSSHEYALRAWDDWTWRETLTSTIWGRRESIEYTKITNYQLLLQCYCWCYCYWFRYWHCYWGRIEHPRPPDMSGVDCPVPDFRGLAGQGLWKILKIEFAKLTLVY